MIEIGNDGADVAFFKPPSDWDTAGKFLLSFNAGACRVLLPRALESWIAELRTGKVARITRQPLPELRLRDGLRLMFDDDSDQPFTLRTELKSVIDILPAREDSGRADLVCSVWVFRRGQPHCSLRLPAVYEDLRVI